MFDCSVPDCGVSVKPENLDNLESVDSRGWWSGMRDFCPEHAEAIQDGTLSREEISSTYTRKDVENNYIDFVEMDGRRLGFPPHVTDTSEIGNMPIDEYHSKIFLEGTCPHSGCDYRGKLVKYTGHNCPHMCPECGGVVHV